MGRFEMERLTRLQASVLRDSGQTIPPAGKVRHTTSGFANQMSKLGPNKGHNLTMKQSGAGEQHSGKLAQRYDREAKCSGQRHPSAAQNHQQTDRLPDDEHFGRSHPVTENWQIADCWTWQSNRSCQSCQRWSSSPRPANDDFTV